MQVQKCKNIYTTLNTTADSKSENEKEVLMTSHDVWWNFENDVKVSSGHRNLSYCLFINKFYKLIFVQFIQIELSFALK